MHTHTYMHTHTHTTHTHACICVHVHTHTHTHTHTQYRHNQNKQETLPRENKTQGCSQCGMVEDSSNTRCSSMSSSSIGVMPAGRFFCSIPELLARGLPNPVPVGCRDDGSAACLHRVRHKGKHKVEIPAANNYINNHSQQTKAGKYDLWVKDKSTVRGDFWHDFR